MKKEIVLKVPSNSKLHSLLSKMKNDKQDLIELIRSGKGNDIRNTGIRITD